jgi:hypothetical protein
MSLFPEKMSEVDVGPLAVGSLADILTAGDARLYCGKRARLRKVNAVGYDDSDGRRCGMLAWIFREAARGFGGWDNEARA